MCWLNHHKLTPTLANHSLLLNDLHPSAITTTVRNASRKGMYKNMKSAWSWFGLVSDLLFCMVCTAS